MDTHTIFFIGKPGCGKGTQAKLLSEITGWSTYSSGDLFRAIAKEESPAGRKVKEENDAGTLTAALVRYVFIFEDTFFHPRRYKCHL